MKPHLAVQLKKARDMMEDEHYVYRLCKNGIWVERKAKVDYGEQSWSDKCEPSGKRLNPKKRLKDLYPIWNKHHPKQKRLESCGSQ